MMAMVMMIMMMAVMMTPAMKTEPALTLSAARFRLRTDYDAIHSGGYRDLHLDLVIQSMEVFRLGISESSFVWELQLQLTPMAKLRTACGHARYVAYRNMRGL